MVYSIDELMKGKQTDINKKPQTKMGFISSKIVEFCNRTDLHGYKYIVMKDLNIFERSCWALAVLVSLVIGIYFVITAYRWYARNPIVTVIESTQAAIWDVPFPAITICDLNLISRKAALQFSKTVIRPDNVSEEMVFEAVRYAPLLHSTYMITVEQKKELYTLQAVLDLNNISLEMFFKNLSPVSSCSQLIERCMWKNTVYRCGKLFRSVFTMQNLCCTFNYFAVTNTKDEDQLSNTGYPRRVASCGYQTALTVVVNTDPEDYYSAFVASQGALVFIDDAYNIPDMDSPARLMGPLTEVMIALSPERTYSTPGIRTFSPEQRQCYFIDEIKIGVFQQYSFHNCIAQQKVEYMKMACRCVPFYFPINESFRICNFYDIDCLEGIIKANEFPNAGISNEIFQCLPECEHFNYHFEVALGTLSQNVHLNGHPFFNGLDLANRSLLNVFFNDLVSTKYRRDVYLNWQNILASFGGLLSLMLGFTLISGFDLILFTFGVLYSYLIKRNVQTTEDVSKVGVQRFKKKNGWIGGSLKKNAKDIKNFKRW